MKALKTPSLSGLLVAPLLLLLASCERAPTDPASGSAHQTPVFHHQPGHAGGGGGGAKPGDEPADPAIAFVKTRGLHNLLMVIDADGSNETVLYKWPTIREPAFRPDASEILFRLGGSIWAIDLAIESGKPVASNQRELLPGCSCDVDWAPDGSSFAVADGPDGIVPGHLRIFSSTGVLVADLLEVPGRSVSSPTWSPTGDRIAFLTRAEASYNDVDIRIVDVSSGQVTPVTTFVGSGDGLAWSRSTDRYLAFDGGGTSGDLEIFILDLTTTSIVEGLGVGRYPTWSPDDQQIVFHQNGGTMLIATEGVGSWSVSSLTGSRAHWADWR